MAVPLLLLTACEREPQWVPMPPQQVFNPQAEPARYLTFIRMNDTKAPAFLSADINPGPPEGVGWRWTRQRPELKFTLEETQNRRVVWNFGITPATFRQTGPVTITFFVNGRMLDRVRYAEPGDRHFEKPVAAEWLKPHQPTLIAAQIDPVFVSPGDGVKLGIILASAGIIGPGEKAE